MKCYVEMIDARKDGLGRQVFFLGFDDPQVGFQRNFQVFNTVLEDKLKKWRGRGYEVVFVDEKP